MKLVLCVLRMTYWSHLRMGIERTGFVSCAGQCQKWKTQPQGWGTEEMKHYSQ